MIRPHVWRDPATTCWYYISSNHTYESTSDIAQCYSASLPRTHTWGTNHVSYMTEACFTCGWVRSHIWIRHVSHVNESCHTYEGTLSIPQFVSTSSYILLLQSKTLVGQLVAIFCSTYSSNIHTEDDKYSSEVLHHARHWMCKNNCSAAKWLWDCLSTVRGSSPLSSHGMC